MLLKENDDLFCGWSFGKYIIINNGSQSWALLSVFCFILLLCYEGEWIISYFKKKSWPLSHKAKIAQNVTFFLNNLLGTLSALCWLNLYSFYVQTFSVGKDTIWVLFYKLKFIHSKYWNLFIVSHIAISRIHWNTSENELLHLLAFLRTDNKQALSGCS